MPNIKPLDDVLKIETYALHRRVKFSLELPVDAEGDRAQDVEVPIAIVHRLHHLGRAFDGQAVKHLRPQGRFRIGFVDTQVLISELELVARVIKDPVTQHYLARLLPLLRTTITNPSSAVRVEES